MNECICCKENMHKANRFVHTTNSEKTKCLDEQTVFFSSVLFCLFYWTIEKWTGKNQILNNSTVITHNKEIFYQEYIETEKWNVMSHKHKKMMTPDANVQMSEVPLITQTLVCSSSPRIGQCPLHNRLWLVSLQTYGGHFTIMGPITVQWLYSVTVWALYSADVFLSVASSQPSAGLNLSRPLLSHLLSSELKQECSAPSTPTSWRLIVIMLLSWLSLSVTKSRSRRWPRSRRQLPRSPPGVKIIDLNSVPFLPSLDTSCVMFSGKQKTFITKFGLNGTYFCFLRRWS